MKKIIISAILGCGLLGNAFAAGDATAGKTKAAVCAGCHGANGIGIADAYPNLAGQHADYIAKQLKAFKDGSRKDPVMAPMAAGLSDQDMSDIAAYFATFSRSGESATAATDSSSTSATPAPATLATPTMVADAATGKSLYENGDTARGITACVACHGKEGNSDVLINPNLSKQHPEYIAKQLNAFKDETRTNVSMNVVAKNLTEQDVADLGAYFKDPAAVATVAAKKPSAAKLTFIGDVEAGKAKAAMCASCHGADGNALVAMYPNLAGQHENYLAKQLADFKAGPEGRNDPVMAGMVAALSPTDMQDLAAYFASQKARVSTTETNKVGMELYQGGDATRAITACIACHGTDGKGAALAGFPAVSNQNVDYLKSQLAKFRDGTRHNDMNSMMVNIAAKLTDADIAAVAEYMSSLK
ncbi:c-type cytochrome [Thalassotalea fonticola]|uniref:C-type cytochrome n=1 Tax=Thalassotalea fonticola TaxID=3065649 RepID=A0ABZ0GMD8_9GAMM|nr:c-type cytochrome [Colwelliaceae bacterium S1-1]